MSGEIKLEYCPTTEMIADVLPKRLGLQKLSQFRKLMPSGASQPSSDDNWEWPVRTGILLEWRRNVFPMSHGDARSRGNLLTRVGNTPKRALFQLSTKTVPKGEIRPPRFGSDGPWIRQYALTKDYEDNVRPHWISFRWSTIWQGALREYNETKSDPLTSRGWSIDKARCLQ